MPVDQKKLPAPVNKFASISPIHGFSYIADASSHLLEDIFWLCVIFVCTALGIRDIIIQLNLYTSEATMVSVEMQRDFNESYPLAAFCFDIDRMGLTRAIAGSFSEAGLHATFSTLALMIENQNGTKLDLSTLPVNDSHWDYLIKTTYLLLAAIIDYDLQIIGRMTNPWDNVTKRALQIVNASFQQLGYDYDELTEQTARYLCLQAQNESSMNCSAQYWLNQVAETCHDLCNSGTLTWFGVGVSTVDDICFSFSGTNANIFQTPNDIINVGTFYLSRPSTLSSQWNASIGLISVPVYGAIDVWFDTRGGREALLDYRSYDGLMYTSDNAAAYYGVEVLSRYNAYNKTNRPCGSESPVGCAVRCLIEERVKNDGCFPLAGATPSDIWRRPSGVPICSQLFSDAEVMAEIVAQRNFSIDFGRFHSCLYIQCTLPPCETMSYQYKVGMPVPNPGIQFTIYPSRFVYPDLTEQLVLDFSGLLSSVGGIIGLYFGGSIIAVVHVPIFSFSLLLRAWKKRRQKKVDYKARTFDLAVVDSSVAKAS